MPPSSTCIALIGYRATGKSSVARLLADRLGWECVDSDAAIEVQSGKSIQQIFGEVGESGFRDVESEIVEQLCSRERTIVALGGGAVLREPNRQAIATCRDVVWLVASIDTIEQRMQADPLTRRRRPKLTRAGGRREFETLLAERTPIYRACATLEVDVESKSPAEIAQEIAVALGLES